jgi:DNA-binding CsgD family transcriptional regulator
MNLIRKNEILLQITDKLSKVTRDLEANTDKNAILSRLGQIEKNILENISNDNNWKRFEENFDMVHENYIKRLGETFPELNISDKKICAYLKMGLSSKDIASLINMSVRSVEMSRYRMRRKMGLDRDANLAEFLQKF